MNNIEEKTPRSAILDAFQAEWRQQYKDNPEYIKVWIVNRSGLEHSLLREEVPFSTLTEKFVKKAICVELNVYLEELNYYTGGLPIEGALWERSPFDIEEIMFTGYVNKEKFEAYRRQVDEQTGADQAAGN